MGIFFLEGEDDLVGDVVDPGLLLLLLAEQGSEKPEDKEPLGGEEGDSGDESDGSQEEFENNHKKRDIPK